MASSSFGITGWLILSGYLVAVVGVGVYFARNEKTTDDFFLAGRRIPWWASGISIFATQLSAITYLGIPARSFGTDWTFFFLNCGILAVAPLVVTIFVPQFRRSGITTAYEYLETRFGMGLRLFGSATFIIFQFGRMGIVLLLPALALSAVTGINLYGCILLMGALSTLYTALGGIEAVIWTDVMQTAVLLGGAIAAIAVMITSLEGGLATIVTVASDAGRLRLIDWSTDPTNAGLPVILSAAIFNNLITYATDQSVIQRYLSTPDSRQAKQAIWLNGLLSIPASALFFFVGTCLFAFYQVYPERMPAIRGSDQIFAAFIAQELPPAVSAMVIAGVFAAAMSSLDSSVHSVATAITTDFIRRLGGVSDPGRLLAAARWLTVLLGAVGTGTALYMATIDVPYLWKLFLDWVGLLGGPLCGLFLLGVLTTTVRSRDAWRGVVASIVMLMLARLVYPVNGLLYGAIGTVSCSVVAYASSQAALWGRRFSAIP